MFTDEHLDVPLDFEGVGGGRVRCSAPSALQIFDETMCVVRAVSRWTEFYAHESCGKCTPCREGTCWLRQIMERLEHGKGTRDDLDKLLDICDNILGPVVLRARRRRRQPDHVVDQVLPRGVRGRMHTAAAASSDPAASTVFAKETVSA